MKYVDEYIFLGQVVFPEKQTDKEIDRRITNS